MNNSTKQHLMRVACVMLLSLFVATTIWSQSATMVNSVNTATAVQSAAMSDDDGMSSAELMKGYIQQCFDKQLPTYQAPQRRAAVAQLSGNDLRAYNYLKEVVKKIAAGEVESTQFEIPLDQINEGSVEYTAADLGISAIKVGGVLSEEAKQKAMAKAGFDISAVNRALLADMPYELYWYDKTKGCSGQYGFSYNSSTVKLKVTKLLFTMNIAQEYAVQEGGNYYPMRFNTSLVTSVNAAVKNAQTVADGATGTLLQRLQYFKDKICEMVDYNQSAVDYKWPYGNPWQLVWVFDGDASTKVVCEGYSKAFKYLCDLSKFSNAECLIATGDMNGGTGAGGHMWNVMKMDDGKSYMVDVTNCDDGTVGAPNHLFMAFGPAGSYTQGYTFTANGHDISYIYDDVTKDNFTEQELTISATKYEDSGATPTPAKYSLTFMVGDKEYAAAEYEEGATIAKPEKDPEKEGYTFKGWKDLPETMPANDLTVSAVFEVNKYKVIYKVDGEEYQTVEVEYGAKITLIAAPTKEGYTFSGWSEAPETMPATDVTIIGTFTKNAEPEPEPEPEPVVITEGGITITVNTDNTAVLNELKLVTGAVAIPAFLKYEGKDYKITVIGEGALKDNTSITEVTVPNGIEKIEARAFMGCSNLKNITLGENVVIVGPQAMSSICIPSVLNVNHRVEGEGLKVYCRAASVPEIASDAFENTPLGNATLIVKDELVDSYRAAAVWKDFGTILSETEASGIGIILQDAADGQFYSVSGIASDKAHKGLNIIRTTDGRTKKVIVK